MRHVTIGFICLWLLIVALQPIHARSPLILINEVMHYPSSGVEWVELYNPGTVPVDLSGWRIDDSVIGGPHTVIGEGVVIAPASLLVIPLTSAILNNNDPDRVILSDPTGQVIDQSPLIVLRPDQTIARQPDGSDTWIVGSPSPGIWNSGDPPATGIPTTPEPVTTGSSESTLSATITITPSATSTATATPSATVTAIPSATLTATPSATATATPSATVTATPSATATPTPSPTPTLPAAVDQVVINEIAAAGEEEWIELYNRGPTAVELAEWRLERVSTSGSRVVRSLPTVTLAAGEWLLIPLAKGTLPDSGAWLTLFWQATALSTAVEYPALSATTVYARVRDGAPEWVVREQATAGMTNDIPEPTIPLSPPAIATTAVVSVPTATYIPTATRTPTATKTPTATRTPTVTKTPTATRTPTVTKTPTTTRTPTASSLPKPTAWPTGVVIISALLPAPATGKYEWIELSSQYVQPIDLQGWFFTDSSGQRRLISEQSLAAGATVRIPITRSFLNNSGDTVILHDPTGNAVDTFSYSAAEIDSIVWRQLTVSSSQTDPGHESNLSLQMPATVDSILPSLSTFSRPTERLPVSLALRSPLSGYLTVTATASPTVTPPVVNVSTCTDCSEPQWPWSRIAAAVLGVIAILLFVTEPKPRRSVRDHQDVL